MIQNGVKAGNSYANYLINESPLRVTGNISASHYLVKNYGKIFNRNNLGALQNYAKQEKLQIFFSELKDDMFHNTKMTVFDLNEAAKSRQRALNIKIDSKQSYADSLNRIYKFAQDALKSFFRR